MKKILFITAALFCILSVVSCNDKLDIQQDYDFTVTTLPVQTKIQKGETAEIRCQLIRTGYWKDAKYTIRYFQPDGKGVLKLEDGTVLSPNDAYPLTKDTFRLYYTSATTELQVIDIYIEDNSGKTVQLTFPFNNVTEKGGSVGTE